MSNEPRTVDELIKIVASHATFLGVSDETGGIDCIDVFYDESFSNQHLEWMTRFRCFDQLEQLSIPGSGISDDGCKSIAAFNQKHATRSGCRVGKDVRTG